MRGAAPPSDVDPADEDVGAAAGRPRLFVLVEHGLSLEAWRSAGGPLNADSPYGYASAANVVNLSWSLDASEGVGRRLVRRAVRRSLGFDLVHAWRNRRSICGPEVVWTHTEREHLAALAILRVSRNTSTRVIAQTVWLWDEWPTISAFRQRMYLSLLQRADVELTHSPANAAVSRVARRTGTVYTIPFGIGVNDALADEVLASTGRPDNPYVLAVGGDRHRDWRTLHAAARLVTDV